MNLNEIKTALRSLINQLPLWGIVFLVSFSYLGGGIIDQLPVRNQVDIHPAVTELVFPSHSLVVNAQEDDSVVFALFPACATASESQNKLVSCLKEMVGYVFFLGIGIFFIRVIYVFVASSLNPGSQNTAKEIKNATYGLVVGIVFIGMPTIIMSLINPQAVTLQLGFLAEFNMGSAAKLIDTTPTAEGCVAFESCRASCVDRFASTADYTSRKNCIAGCQTIFASCSECFEFINEVGKIKDDGKEEYAQCIVPVAASTAEARACTSFDQCLTTRAAGEGANYTCGVGNFSCNREMAVCLNANASCRCANKSKFVSANGGNGDEAYSGPQNPTELIECLDEVAEQADIDDNPNNNGVIARIDPLRWSATAPSQQCRLNNYGTSLDQINTSLIDYDMRFLGGTTAKINRDAKAGFDCVKNRLQIYQDPSSPAKYNFPGNPGSPDYAGPYTFQFSNTTGRPLDDFSFHPFGLAIDLNVPNNCGEYQLAGCTNIRRDMPKTVVFAFNQCGFFWGGEWNTGLNGVKFDPMHFEYHAIACPGEIRTGVTQP